MSQVCGNSEWMVNGVHCLKVPRTAEEFAVVFRQILEGKINLEPLGRRTSAMVRRDFHLKTIDSPDRSRAWTERSRRPGPRGEPPRTRIGWLSWPKS